VTVFQNPTDIANRALQHCGVRQIAAGLLATENSTNALEIRSCYDKLRVAEQRRAVWRYTIRKAALRPIGTFNASKFVTFATWASGTTYNFNDVVIGSDGEVYYSLTASNIAHDPTSTSGFWTNYFGPLTAQECVTTWGSGFTYALGDHAVGSDGSVYVSLAAANTNHNPVGDSNVHWEIASTADSDDVTAATATSFFAGELVFIGVTTYLSLQSGNQDTPPTAKWRTLTAAPTLILPNLIYPLGSGPFNDSSTRNVFRLPNGFLRKAPRSPKAGEYSVLGAPSNLLDTDWEFEGNYFTSSFPGPVIFRFAADVSDVLQMDPLFCEYFACRIAMEVCERLTQSTTKLKTIASMYKMLQTEAIAVNGIETDPTEPPLDDYIACRV
jgi:hypothetical protein